MLTWLSTTIIRISMPRLVELTVFSIKLCRVLRKIYLRYFSLDSLLGKKMYLATTLASLYCSLTQLKIIKNLKNCQKHSNYRDTLTCWISSINFYLKKLWVVISAAILLKPSNSLETAMKITKYFWYNIATPWWAEEDVSAA